MTAKLAVKAGQAVIWKSIQLAGVQLIFLLRLLILARLLLPEDFGLIAVALVPIGLLLSMSDLGMIPALVQQPRPQRQDYDTAWTIGLLRAFAIAAVLFAAAPLFSNFAGEPRAAIFIRVLALRPILDATASIKIAELTRELDFRSLAWIQLTDAAVNTVVATTLAKPIGVWALVVGALAGAGSYVLMSYVLAPHRPRLLVNREATDSLIRFGRWIFASSLLAVVGGAALRVIISRQLGIAELGLYFMAVRLGFLPAQLCSEVAGAVAFPVISRLKSDRERVARAFRATFSGLSAILAPITLLLIVLAPELVREVLGPSWLGTAPLIQIMATTSLLSLLGEIAVPVFKGVGQPRRVAMVEAVQSSTLVILAWYFARSYGLLGAAAAWIPAVAVSQILSAMLLKEVLIQPFSGLGARAAAVLTASVVAAGASLSVAAFVPGRVGLLVAVLGGLASALAVLLVVDRHCRLGLLDDLRDLFPGIASRLPASEAES